MQLADRWFNAFDDFAEFKVILKNLPHLRDPLRLLFSLRLIWDNLLALTLSFLALHGRRLVINNPGDLVIGLKGFHP